MTRERSVLGIATIVARAGSRTPDRRAIYLALALILWLAGCWDSHGVTAPVVEPDGGVPPPADADGDGYTEDVDCNDHNASIHPGAFEEPCPDGVDQDCDGEDGRPEILINCAPEDRDGDGYTADVDCNDDDASIHPGAPEFECGLDGIDSNCDGWDYGEACERDPECISWLCNG
jgi:hypothetical protein